MKAKKIDPGRAKLEKELRDAVEEVDEEGLLFLLRQAQILIYNARVDRINEAGKQIKGGKSREMGAPVSVEETEGGKQIFLTIGRVRKILTPEEMRRIVRICYASETKSEALRQLFTVLAKERKDILADANIGNPDNPMLETLFTTVRATYKLKDR